MYILEKNRPGMLIELEYLVISKDLNDVSGIWVALVKKAFSKKRIKRN